MDQLHFSYSNYNRHFSKTNPIFGNTLPKATSFIQIYIQMKP